MVRHSVYIVKENYLKQVVYLGYYVEYVAEYSYSQSELAH